MATFDSVAHSIGIKDLSGNLEKEVGGGAYNSAAKGKNVLSAGMMMMMTCCTEFRPTAPSDFLLLGAVYKLTLLLFIYLVWFQMLLVLGVCVGPCCETCGLFFSKIAVKNES